jgi:threonine synthase
MSGAFYASHVWNPWFLEGTKRYVFELLEQLDRLPRTLVLPAGNGTLVLGARRAFREIGQVARIVAVQAAGCAPIANAFAAGRDRVTAVDEAVTIAAGIAIAAPVRGDEILDAVRSTGGTFMTVTDDEIIAAQHLLADAGLDVEPTAAAPAAAVRRINDEDLVIPIASGSVGSAGVSR